MACHVWLSSKILLALYLDLLDIQTSHAMFIPYSKVE